MLGRAGCSPQPSRAGDRTDIDRFEKIHNSQMRLTPPRSAHTQVLQKQTAKSKQAGAARARRHARGWSPARRRGHRSVWALRLRRSLPAAPRCPHGRHSLQPCGKATRRYPRPPAAAGAGRGSPELCRVPAKDRGLALGFPRRLGRSNSAAVFFPGSTDLLCPLPPAPRARGAVGQMVGRGARQERMFLRGPRPLGDYY